MTKLQCLNCGKIFDKKDLASYATAGVGGFGSCFSWTAPLVWPIVLRVYATCPICRERGWITVLKPWIKR